MALSNFYVDYTDGMPPIDSPELMYFNAAINDYAGGISALEPVEGTQAHVKVQVESSESKLHELKSDERCEWIEDVDWADNL